MNHDYQELITTVSHQIAQEFLDHEPNLAQRAVLLDADIAEITRAIGLETTKIVLEQFRDQLVKKTKWTG